MYVNRSLNPFWRHLAFSTSPRACTRLARAHGAAGAAFVPARVCAPAAGAAGGDVAGVWRGRRSLRGPFDKEPAPESVWPRGRRFEPGPDKSEASSPSSDPGPTSPGPESYCSRVRLAAIGREPFGRGRPPPRRTGRARAFPFRGVRRSDFAFSSLPAAATRRLSGARR
jgi:hypothetical protein